MNSIEHILFHHQTWVKASIFARVIGIAERDLRGVDSPIRDFAISGDKGYIHIANATPEEIDHFCARLTLHATEELKRVARVREIRMNYEHSDLFENK